ncbi:MULTISPECIES: LysR substrate-binding domain-containing protein [Paraburkholderia]|uniref:LysR family transcriptional regulator n=1 Tax=Paraburkholderia tropica TaxID=92647 RepID=A0A1A5WZ78_9BURK|nr:MULTISPECIES: LysR substrate-binding domain-containing protein [Paraburkholderia]MBB2981708.1 DNA-binding transcriptional LysR family regulator [Paraburkholderia tropica]MBB3002947.1 DNA-binding transcriptional LysR family regulator [Paraburkholderia tropica]MBB6320631.1 DNA-binding transcriptional LysR family regulator [Paraburkholderia tropica]MDE1138402.1 LysR substrate-binding domain-containing protein [Paraburkholderia tropica]OBR46384.1 transcriptional regulator [Paraburkholderia trop
MSRSLPPLQALRALEAAARRRSFSRAAEELHLTHSAVSHHLRGLEAELGVELFRRAGGQMIPTAAGAQLADRVRRSLDDLRDALDATRPGVSGVTRLELSVMADFASVWLIPRLGDFYDRHPDVDLSMRMHADVTPPDPYPFDIGIWHRRVDEPGFQIRKLLDDQVVAVCSPSLLARYPDFRIEDLPGMPLLRFARRSWRDFFEAAGVTGSEPERGPVFDDAGLLLQATVAGQGAATARLQLARDFIERGELVQLGQVRIPASLDYYFTWREGHPRDAAIQQFYRWIKSQLAR